MPLDFNGIEGIDLTNSNVIRVIILRWEKFIFA